MPEGAAGETTLGVIEMLFEVAVLGPLQPLAVTLTVAVPVRLVGKAIELLAPEPVIADPLSAQL